MTNSKSDEFPQARIEAANAFPGVKTNCLGGQV